MSDEQEPTAEENPFESPRMRSAAPVAQSSKGSSSKSSPSTIVRRGMILLISTLLIPPAVIIAFSFGCFASAQPFQSLAVGVVGGSVAGLGVLVGLCYIANKLWNYS